MKKTLTQGVRLTVEPTQQFKTTRIAIHFLAPLTQADAAARTLLTSVLETASAELPTQAEMSAQLENMFGASFGIGVGKEGRLHRVSANLTVLNDAFAQEDLLAQGFAFLNSTLFAPLMADGLFDAAIFERERHNLSAYLSSLNEDRQTQATMGLQKLYYGDDLVQATPAFGTVATLADVTPAHLVEVYRQMLAEDRIEIMVLGDVDPDAVVAVAEKLAFAPRAIDSAPLDVDLPVTAVRRADEIAPVLQAKLNLAYHVDTDYFGPKHYAALVANELFGGSPQSMLFVNVREHESLAYYASSSLNAVRHMVAVQTGIDAENQARVEALVATQLALVQNGEFSDDLLQVMKDGLISNRETASDQGRYLSRQAFLASLWANQPMLDEFTQGVSAVTRKQVMAAAKTFVLQAVYCLHKED